MPQPLRSGAAQPPRPDAALWEAFGRDRSAGLGAIYDRYGSVVYGVARAILGSAEEAEDLTQEIFTALSSRCDYDPSRGSLAAYLLTLTRSRSIDRLRGGSRRLRSLERYRAELPDDNQDRVLERISVMQLSREVGTALGSLPEHQRRVLEMAYFRGLSQSEIAAELAEPLGTVKSWTRLGLFGLRNALRHLVE
jgi:RNA polymerase sigma-70 factor (ECF subfamily)